MHGVRAIVRDLIFSVTVVVVIISTSRFPTLRTSVMAVATHLDAQLYMRAECGSPTMSPQFGWT
jgi:hypothetical protein